MPHLREKLSKLLLVSIWPTRTYIQQLCAIWDVALRTDWKQWTIEKGGGRGSGRSVLMNEVFILKGHFIVASLTRADSFKYFWSCRHTPVKGLRIKHDTVNQLWGWGSLEPSKYYWLWTCNCIIAECMNRKANLNIDLKIWIIILVKLLFISWAKIRW